MSVSIPPGKGPQQECDRAGAMQETSGEEPDALTALLAILLATIAMHLIGTATLLAIVSGPFYVLATPFVAMFGWYFLPVEAVVALLQWTMVDGQRRSRLALAWVMTALPAAVFMAVVGPKEEGDLQLWTVGYAIATLLAATASLKMIDALKRERA
ncbi:hypothetical protein [Aeoliella mucimassa]|uniref:Uncharacterized protein n=1 Tax=Aeoliella mucimassa TaxID=2527972 RepID=A0A518AIG4_9BACT|nr:hypothetical protein [Aeoliella mucimassa]QDU54525.1 hypothetical protein Pan181_07070 [Aeoliella mucimassa]